MEIARLSDLIKQDIQALNVGLVDLQNLSATAKATNTQSKGHSTTIVDSLRLRLKDATKDFQNVLQTRKENLERNRERQQQFSSAAAPDRQPLFNPPRPGLPPLCCPMTAICRDALCAKCVKHYSTLCLS